MRTKCYTMHASVRSVKNETIFEIEFKFMIRWTVQWHNFEFITFVSLCVWCCYAMTNSQYFSINLRNERSHIVVFKWKTAGGRASEGERRKSIDITRCLRYIVMLHVYCIVGFFCIFHAIDFDYNVMRYNILINKYRKSTRVLIHPMLLWSKTKEREMKKKKTNARSRFLKSIEWLDKNRIYWYVFEPKMACSHTLLHTLRTLIMSIWHIHTTNVSITPKKTHAHTHGMVDICCFAVVLYK